jgi:hypothetical protein
MSMTFDDLPRDTRPAVVNGKLVWVPAEGMDAPGSERHLDRWSALAAAVLAQAAFDELGFTAEPPIDLD